MVTFFGKLTSVVKKSLPGIGVGALFFLYHVSTASAAGISPSQLNVESILRNTKQERTFSITKNAGELNEAQFFTVQFSGDFASTFSGLADFEIPAGTQDYNYTLTIQPADAPNGEYSGNIMFLQVPAPTSNQSTASVAVVRGLTVRINYAVDGTEKTEYTLSNLVVHTAEEDDAIPVAYTVDNTGNVAWRPTRVELTFRNKNDSGADKTVAVDGEALEYSNPGSRSVFSIDTDTRLSQGTYIATGVFYDGSTIAGTIESLQFDIVGANTLAQKGKLIDVKTNKTEYQPGENIKIEAQFTNIGDVRLDAIIVADVYKGDRLVDYVRGESATRVDLGETTTLGHVVNFSEPGKYRLSVGVEYGAKKTEFIDVTVTVAGTAFSGVFISVIAIFILCVIIIFILIFWKRSKKRKEKTSVPPSTVSVATSETPFTKGSNKYNLVIYD